MKHLLMTAVTALLLSVGTTWADPFEDGVAAYGRGSYAVALRTFRSVAERGNSQAQHNLGVMYAKGQGVTADYAEAAKWYRLAAEQGHAQTKYNLAVLYSDGQGVAQDFVRAHLWLNLAAESKHDLARKNRDLIAIRMTPQQLADSQKLARDCQRQEFKGCD